MKKYYATYLTVPVPVPVPHRPLASLFAINSGLNKPAFYSTNEEKSDIKKRKSDLLPLLRSILLAIFAEKYNLNKDSENTENKDSENTENKGKGVETHTETSSIQPKTDRTSETNSESDIVVKAETTSSIDKNDKNDNVTNNLGKRFYSTKVDRIGYKSRSYSTLRIINRLALNSYIKLNEYRNNFKKSRVSVMNNVNSILNERYYAPGRPIKNGGVKDVNPRRLSIFLKEISKILEENRGDPYAAQLTIESRWNDLTFETFKFKSEIYGRQRGVIENGLKVLQLYKDNGNLTRTFKPIIDYIVKFENVYLAFSIILSYYTRMRLTNIQHHIARNILYSIYKRHFKDLFNTFNDFKNAYKIDDSYYIKLGNVFTEIFISQLNPVFKVNFESEGYEIKINNEFEEDLLNNLIVAPQSIPMLCKPEKWSDDNYGGFLLNNTEDFKNGLVIGSKQHGHKIIVNDYMYNAINHLGGQEFKINYDLVDYLENEGTFILEMYRENDYNNFINNQISLEIAKTFNNYPFYLNTNIDWRGRIYTQSFYLDYQGSEFSLALINMSKGKKLEGSGKFFFYVYGANVYNENGLNKKSFQERYEWVNKNLENIYCMDKDFILNAESPTTFAAFCLNMRKLKDNPCYEISMPIFLDATCSGIQHFAAMVLDVNLAKHVNLISSETVNDIYSALIPKINAAINDSWLKDTKLEKFKDIELNRDLLKRTIMTKSYSISTYGIAEQLKSKFEKVAKTLILNEKEHVVYDYKVPSRNKDGYVLLDIYEIDKLSAIINDNIFCQFPILNSIYEYLSNMAKILIKLELPITWYTPNGLELTQRYNLSERHKATINFMGKNKTVVLRKWLDRVDTRREVDAIIPNIIHSLDASHLLSVINNWDSSKYILPIHDCFGTHPNDMENLAVLVRAEFVSIYSRKDFLKTIDEKFNNDLKNYKVEILNVKGVAKVKIKSKKRYLYIDLPVLPKYGDLNLSDILEGSSYMIS